MLPGESEARRTLRQEVAFGCPICRDPFLTYHHFDPPWREREHWETDGIITLCARHHAQADGGHYTKAYLRSLKRMAYSVDDVRARYPWEAGEFLVRLGGSYTGGASAILRVDGEEIIRLSRGEVGGLWLSFHLRSADGTTVATMQDNVFGLHSGDIYDLVTDTHCRRIKLWFAERDISLQVSLSYPSVEELERVLCADRDRAQAKMSQAVDEPSNQLRGISAWLPEDLQKDLGELMSEALGLRSDDETGEKVAEHRRRRQDTTTPDHVLWAHFSGDPVGYKVRRWAISQGLSRDGRIALLNFENLSVFGRDKHIRIRNGMACLDYNASFGCETAFHL